MKAQFALAVLALAIAFPCLAQEKSALVWIDPSDQHASYLQAAVLRKHTPVSFTTDKSKADYIASLTTDEKKGSTARAVFLGPANSGARSTISLTVADTKTSNVVSGGICHSEPMAAISRHKPVHAWVVLQCSRVPERPGETV